MRHSAFTRLIGVLIVLIAASAVAQEKKGITAYQETVNLREDGSADVKLDVTVAGLSADHVDLPLNFAKPEDLTVAGGGAASASIARIGDVRVIRLQLGQSPATEVSASVRFVARAFLDWKKARSPRGIYTLSYTYANNVPATIGDYRLKIILPQGYEMNSVTSSTPRMSGEEVQPPYDFGLVEGQTVVNLRAKSLGPGKTAAIAFGFVPAERNTVPLIVIGLLIAAAALWIKRDVLTRPDFVREAAA